jgi:hypothetical protein
MRPVNPARLSSSVFMASICCALSFGWSGSVDAQRIAAFDAPMPGDCELLLNLSGVAPGSTVGADVEFTRYPAVVVGKDARSVSIRLAERLRAGYRLEARVDGQVAANSAVVVPARSDHASRGTCLGQAVKRVAAGPPLRAWLFYGSEVDNFTADSVEQYRNTNTDFTNRKTQQIFGVNFEYHAGSHFVLSGESLHAVRTVDIDCTSDEAQNAKICLDHPATNPNDLQKQARFLLENASSLELALFPRWNLYTIGGESESPVAAYVTGRIGVTSTRGVPFVLQAYWAGPGLVAKDGPLEGSFIEYTFGTNEQFGPGVRRRGDAVLSFRVARIPVIQDNMRLFIEGVLDEGRRPHPTSYRTFFGMDVDIRAISR